MNTIAAHQPRESSSCCSASPLMEGMRMSSNRQPRSSGTESWAARNASALSYSTTSQPTESRRKTSERRKAASSSTRYIDSFCIVFMVWQAQRKDHSGRIRPAFRMRGIGRPAAQQLTAVRFDNPLANGQPQAQAIRLAGVEGLEQPLLCFGRHAGPEILHMQPDPTGLLFQQNPDALLPPGSMPHGVLGV